MLQCYLIWIFVSIRRLLQYIVQRCQLLKIKCGWKGNSASQRASYSKSPNWSPGVKTLKTFAVWPQYYTGRSYLRTKLLDKLKYFSSVIHNYKFPSYATTSGTHSSFLIFSLNGNQYSSDCSLGYNDIGESKPTWVAVYTHELFSHEEMMDIKGNIQSI